MNKFAIYLKFIVAIFLGGLMLTFSSCHESGCTDPKAINYNITADKDDGSCILCSSSESMMDTVTTYLIDKYFGSPHYNDSVAKFDLYQKKISQNDKYCGADESTISLKITSLVNQTMYVNYRVQNYSGPVYIYIYDAITIAPLITMDKGIVSTNNSPPFLPIGLDSIIVNNYDQIAYY